VAQRTQKLAANLSNSRQIMNKAAALAVDAEGIDDDEDD
jgi:hypothetical protein